MNSKKIKNIVFYQFFDKEDSDKQVCIFYEDGTVRNVGFDDGIDACEELVREYNIQSKDAFREMINKNLVHVVSGDEFEANFRNYFPININDAAEEAKEPVSMASSTDDSMSDESIVDPVVVNDTSNSDDDYDDTDEDEYDDYDDSYDDDLEDEDFKDDSEEKPKGFFARTWDKIKNNKLVRRVLICATALAVGLGLYSCHSRKTLEGQMNRSNITTTVSNDNNSSKDDIKVVGSNDFYDNYNFNQLQEVTNNEFQKTAMKNVHDALNKFNNEFASHYLENGKNVRASLKFDEVVALQMAYNDYSKKDIKAYFNGAEIETADLTRAYKDASLQLMGAYAMENSKYPVDMSMLVDSQEGKDFYNKYHKAFLAAKEATGDDKISKVTEFYRMVRSDFPISEKVRTEGISHAQNYEELESYKLSVTPMIAAAEMMWQNLRTDVTLKDGEIDFLNDLGLCNYADKTFEKIETITLTAEEDDTNPLYSQYRDAMIKEFKDLGYYYVDDEKRELTKLQSFQDAVNWHFNEKGESKVTSGVKSGTVGAPQTTTRTETQTHTETHTTYQEVVTRENKVMPSNIKDQIDAQINSENEEARRRAEAEAEENRRRLQEEADREAREIRQEVREDAEDLQDDIEWANEQIEKNQDNNPNNDRPINEDDFGYHDVDFDRDHSDSHGNLDSSVQNITTDSSGDMTNKPLPDPNVTGKKFDEAAPEATQQSTTVTNDSNTSSVIYTEEVPVSEVNAVSTKQVPVAEGNTTPVESTVVNSLTSAEEPVTTSSSEDAWVESVPVSDDYNYEAAWIERDGSDEVTYVYVSDDNSSENTDVSSQKQAVTNEQIVDDYIEAMASTDSGESGLEEYGSELQEENFDEGYQYVR